MGEDGREGVVGQAEKDGVVGVDGRDGVVGEESTETAEGQVGRESGDTPRWAGTVTEMRCGSRGLITGLRSWSDAPSGTRDGGGESAQARTSAPSFPSSRTPYAMVSKRARGRA